MRREERVTVQGPVKKQPDGMSHRGWIGKPPLGSRTATDRDALEGAGGWRLEGGGSKAVGKGVLGGWKRSLPKVWQNADPRDSVSPDQSAPNICATYTC